MMARRTLVILYGVTLAIFIVSLQIDSALTAPADDPPSDPPDNGLLPPPDTPEDSEAGNHTSSANETAEADDLQNRNPDYEFFEEEPDMTGASMEEETPFAFPDNKVSLGYGEKCHFYGPQFLQIQKSPDFMPKKVEQISEVMCRLNQRLECVPLVHPPTIPPPRRKKRAAPPNSTTTTTTVKTTTTTIGNPKPTNQMENRDPELEGRAYEPITSGNHTSEGRCVCARSLGERAVFIRADKEKHTRGGCFIPAGFDLASQCDHEAALPYGDIDNGTVHQRTLGNSAKLCVPNAECRAGYTYTGYRCRCKEGARWFRKNGTCISRGLGTNLRSSTTVILMYLVISLIYSHEEVVHSLYQNCQDSMM